MRDERLWAMRFPPIRPREVEFQGDQVEVFLEDGSIHWSLSEFECVYVPVGFVEGGD